MRWHLKQKEHEETEVLTATHVEKLDIILMNVLQRRHHEMRCSVSRVKALDMCLKYVPAKKHRIRNKEHKEGEKEAEVVVVDEGVGVILFRRYKMTVTLTQRKRGGGESRRSAWGGKGWRRTRRPGRIRRTRRRWRS